MPESPLIAAASDRGADHDPTLVPRLGLIIAVFVASLIQTRLVTQWLMLHTVWIAPGVMLAICYRFSGQRRWYTLILMALADMMGARLAGARPAGAMLFALVHLAEALAAATALRRIAPGGLDLAKPRSAIALGTVALLVAPPVGLGIDLLLQWVSPQMIDEARYVAMFPGPRQIVEIMARWVLPGALGIVLVAPLCLGLLNRAAMPVRRMLTRRRIAGHALVTLATTIVFFSQGSAYLAFLPPVLVWIGVRLGIVDLGAAILLSLLIASAAVAMGNGPSDVLNSAPHVRQMFLEITYLCFYGWIMPVVAALKSRERLERDLARALESHSQILRNLNEVVFRLDAHAHWTFLNPAWEQVTGYRIEDSIGRWAMELILPDDLAATIEQFNHLAEGRLDEVQLQRQFRRRDAELRNVDITVRALRGADGRFEGALGSIRDITDELQQMHRLQESEQRFRRVCDSSPAGIIRLSRKGKITYLNSRCELIVLALSERLLGQTWAKAFGKSSASVWPELVDVLVTPGTVYERELEMVDRAGLRRWLALSVTGEFDAGTRPVGYIAAVIDITASKQAQVELAARTAELRVITENISDIVYRIGLDGRHLFATPSVREVLGHAPHDVIGQRMGERIHPEDRDRMLEAFRRLARGEMEQVSIAFREFLISSDSDVIWLEANSRLLRDQAGKPQEIVSALRDVTRSKKLEFELIEARRRAEAATRAKSQFLANLSHEIRTPMNGVIGLADLLLGNTLDPVSRRYVETIAQSGHTMMKLLNDILDIARVDSGRMQLSNAPFDLNECLAGSLQLMTASAMGKGLDLQLQIAPGTPRHVVGDNLRLRQVLANLVGNAVKFTAHGHVRLGARREGDRLVITVKDSGIGIAPDQQARIFEEFVQVDATIAGFYGGSGLGLSISRRLTEAMGGTLALSSVPDQGTTLILTLPLVLPAAATMPARPAALPVPDPATGRLHLLLAEDNQTNQMIMTAMLQRLGHSVDVAGCGEDVIERVEAACGEGRPFDGVLMDIQMPGMDGLDAARQLRLRGHDAASLPIIAVTANGYREDIDACIAAGMQGHLVKPVRVADLAGEIDRMTIRRAAA